MCKRVEAAAVAYARALLAPPESVTPEAFIAEQRSILATLGFIKVVPRSAEARQAAQIFVNLLYPCAPTSANAVNAKKLKCGRVLKDVPGFTAAAFAAFAEEFSCLLDIDVKDHQHSGKSQFITATRTSKNQGWHYGKWHAWGCDTALFSAFPL